MNVGNVLNLFNRGVAVANPQAWRTGQVTANVIGGVILAAIPVATAMGHPFNVDQDTANEIGAAVLTAINIVVGFISNAHIGIAKVTATPPVA